MFLPRVRAGSSRPLRHLCMEFVACLAPRLELFENLRSGFHRLEAWRDSFEIAALDRKEEANRLTGLEADVMVPAQETPVHGKRVRRPIGLNDAGERVNPFLWPIGRAAYP